MFQRPRGTRDFGPDEMAGRNRAMELMRGQALRHGFREIQMPLFEDLELFTTKSGPSIVEELYAFKDKGGRDIALRPEMTAQVMRFFVNELSKLPKPLKLFYSGPCFRYENPQSGRYREFYQFGAEIIGASTPETNAEVIGLAASLLDSLGLRDYEIRLGHIGVFRRMLSDSNLPESEIAIALHHLDKNDSEKFKSCALQNKVPPQQIEKMLSIRNLRGGTEILDQLEVDEAREHLTEIVRYLDKMKVRNFSLDMGIIRGLDYYSGMVFEIDAPSLGAEKQICGGGSYDLVSLFGGEEAFTTGFALGFDRVLIALGNEGFGPKAEPPEAYMIPIGDEARERAIELTAQLRSRGIATDLDLMRRSLSKNLKYASLLGAHAAIILGEKELAKDVATLRDMTSGDQTEVQLSAIAEHLIQMRKN